RLLAGDEDLATSIQNTMVMPAAAAPAGSEDATQIITPVRRERTTPKNRDNASTLKAKSDRRRAKGYWLFGLVLLLAGLAAGTGWYFGSGPGSLVTVPSVSGQSVEAATTALVAADLQVADAPLHAYDPEVPAGLVAGTDPAAGQAVAHDGLVKLIISDGPEPLPIPDLVGQPEDVAKDRATDGGFTLEESQYQFHPEVAEGIVIDALGVQGEETVSLPPLKTYGEQQPITLVVSLGPIPDVSNLTIEEAQQRLQGAKLNGVEGKHAFHDTIEAGKVISAQAQTDPVREGDTVSLIISDGIEQVEVPNVIDMTWREAKPILEAAGFVLDYSKTADGFPDGARVSKVKPGAGEKVDKGSTLKINFGLFF
ncbi:MAG TPA: PASTA domain-containing protein, partial [Homoserinimonas sp.]|nr:PASTA domain-containing protein [Homoserinimonas sp.]